MKKEFKGRIFLLTIAFIFCFGELVYISSYIEGSLLQYLEHSLHFVFILTFIWVVNRRKEDIEKESFK